MKILKDGNAYLVCKDDFVDLHESHDECFFIDEAEFRKLDKLLAKLTLQSGATESGRQHNTALIELDEMLNPNRDFENPK